MRPSWLGSLWGALITVTVMLSSRAAHAETSGASSTLALLSAGVAATLERGVSDSDLVTEPPPVASIEVGHDDSWPVVEVHIAPWLAGLCDARGATAIAEMPAMPVRDGVVAADDSGCEGSVLRAGRTMERHEHSSSPPPLEALDPALLPTLWQLPPAPVAHELPFPAAAQFRLPRGFNRGIDEPPRG